MSHENMTEIRYREGLSQILIAIGDEVKPLDQISDDHLIQIESACDNLATACALELEERGVWL